MAAKWLESLLNPRVTTAVTTGSINAGANATLTIPLGKGFRLFTIQGTRACRVQLYTTAAAMAADAGRSVGTDPAADAGVVLDYVLIDTALHSLSPQVSGASLEATPSNNISMRVTNNGSTGTVTVTFTGAQVE